MASVKHFQRYALACWIIGLYLLAPDVLSQRIPRVHFEEPVHGRSAPGPPRINGDLPRHLPPSEAVFLRAQPDEILSILRSGRSLESITTIREISENPRMTTELLEKGEGPEAILNLREQYRREGRRWITNTEFDERLRMYELHTPNNANRAGDNPEKHHRTFRVTGDELPGLLRDLKIFDDQPTILRVDLGNGPPDWYVNRSSPDDPLVLEISHVRHPEEGEGDFFGRVLGDTRYIELESILHLREVPVSEIQVVNLLPQSAEHLGVWGSQYTDHRLIQDFVAWGRKFQSKLQQLDAPVIPYTTKQTLVDQLRLGIRNGRRVTVVIGEQASNGGIRIPGSTDVLRRADLIVNRERVDNYFSGSEIPQVFVVLSCKSGGEWGGISARSTIYTNESYNFVTLLLDRRTHASIAEFVNIGIPSNAKLLEEISKSGSRPGSDPTEIDGLTLLLALADHRTFGAAVLLVGDWALRRSDDVQLDSATSPYVDSSRQTMPTSREPRSNTWSLPLFLYGMSGGFMREILRWGRLRRRRRADLYVRTKYAVISATMVLLSGVVGLAVASAILKIPGPLIALASGYSAEEIMVAMAKVVQTLLPRPVAQAEGANWRVPASVLDFVAS